MCAAPCAALTGGCQRNAAGFHVGRLLGYTLAGGVAGASVAALGGWVQVAPALRPLWVMLHLAFIGLGLWWLVRGRSPALFDSRRGDGEASVRFAPPGRPLASAGKGLAWVAWPCGALHGALVLASLSGGALAGAAVMAAFALASMPGLTVLPLLWARWRKGRPASSWLRPETGLRIAGLCLVAGSTWAVGHGAWDAVAAWCSAV
ncbi:MAG TPA: sulfite exporter TauE/SafE family protein, partial [Rubrivivax sp.]|nr:sulfite exporter TauE/SafE family protein [Rubrivivax sp.]